MSNREQALAFKAKGNAAFSGKNWEEAIKEFSAAIELDPTDHVFFSNRSASYASMEKYKEALEDADACIKIKPDWAKGYTRKGLAAFHLDKVDEAKAAYEKGLEIDPQNQPCKDGLEQISAKGANPMAGLFGPGMWAKLQNNPVTREYLKDPAFVQKCNMLQSNPNALSQLGTDPQMTQAIGVILGIDLSGGGAGAPPGGPDPSASTEAPKKEEPKKEEPKNESDDEEMPDLEEEVSEEEKLAKANKAKAVEEKTAGNKFYVKKQFAEALSHYTKAQELDPENPTYISNEAAVYMEQKDFQKCIDTCQKAIDTATAKSGYDYALVGKLYLRMATGYEKMDNYDEAAKYASKSRMEDGNNKAKIFEKSLAAKRKKFEELAYLDKDKSEEAKALGNECFTAQKWVDAIGHYSEALKRDPTNHKIYSNRAACYTKLMDWNSAMKDVEKCLEIDPTFVKAYIRKGKIQHFLKQYHKALETFQKGLDLDPACSELIEGKRNVMQAINRENQEGKVDPARAKEAMKDPEIQAILSDPMINNILQQMQKDPSSAQRALADPTVRGKIEKLVAAGILQVA